MRKKLLSIILIIFILAGMPNTSYATPATPIEIDISDSLYQITETNWMKGIAADDEDEDGYVYIADFQNNKILKKEKHSGEVTSIAAISSNLNLVDIAYYDGYIYYAAYDWSYDADKAYSVYKIDTSGNSDDTYTNSTATEDPIALAVNSGGIYLSGYDWQITKLPFDKSDPIISSTYEGGLDDPRDIDVDSTGQVWVADGYQQTPEKNVKIFSANLQTVDETSVIYPSNGDPVAIALDEKNSLLYLADDTTKNIIYCLDLKSYEVLRTYNLGSGITDIAKISVSSSGEVFIAAHKMENYNSVAYIYNIPQPKVSFYSAPYDEDNEPSAYSNSSLWKPQLVNLGAKATKPVLNPVKTDDYFDKWLNEDGDPFDFSNAITTTKAIYASWTGYPSAGNALKFDGNYDEINNNGSSITIDQAIDGAGDKDKLSAFTIEAWVYKESDSPDNQFIYRKGYKSIQLHTIANHGLRFQPAPGVYLDTPDNSLPAGEWTHIATVYDPSEEILAKARLYIDGNEVTLTKAAIEGNLDPGVEIENNTSLLYIGGGKLDSDVGVDGTTWKYFFGKIDEFRMWSKALTQEEIKNGMDTVPDVLDSDLLTYLNFNQGVADGNNTSLGKIVYDLTGKFNGETDFFSFAAGSASNYVESFTWNNIEVDGTANFGDVYVGNYAEKTFTIENTGLLDLKLTGAPSYVSISGINATDFSITQNPESTITGSATTSFKVKFAPKSSGTKNATLSITNNVLGKNPTTVAIQGNGIKVVQQSNDSSDDYDPKNIVYFNGQAERVVTENTSFEKGKSVVTASLDNYITSNKIESIIKNNNKISNKIEIPVLNTTANTAKVLLTGDIVKKLENNNFSVSINRGNVQYNIPAKEINIDTVASKLSIDSNSLSKIEVSVQITKPDETKIKLLEAVAKQNSSVIVHPPLEFNITANTLRKDGTTEQTTINKFEGYVERVIELPKGVDPNKITTGIVLNDDGTFSHIPTTVFEKEGKYYAKINSLTNSTYSVIWNPVMVASVENHWSKLAVNDMASRLVIDKKENFSPDKAITRGEFAQYIAKALGIYRTDIKATKKYSDVLETNELATAITIASDYGIINGYPDNTFRPTAQITREEAMTMYARAMKIVGLTIEDENRINNFKDNILISDWAYESVKNSVGAKVFNGKNLDTLDPQGTFTCAESVTAIRNLLIKARLINE